MRIHDESFPADGGAWFFEVDPHNDEEFVFHFLCEDRELFGIASASFGVVNRAGPDDEEESRTGDEERFLNLSAGIDDELRFPGAGCDFPHEEVRRGEDGVFEDT